MASILFVNWEGPKTSYLEGVFLPILQGLAKKGHSISILYFGWESDNKFERVTQKCQIHGIHLVKADVYRKPVALGGVISAVVGGFQIKQICKTRNVDVIIPRSLMPALATLISLCKRRKSIVYEADGFPADEMIEFRGGNPRSITYRALREIERRILMASHAAITRTNASIEILTERSLGKINSDSIFVVPSRRPLPDAKTNSASLRKQVLSPRLCYVGSLGEQYRPDEMLIVADQIKNRWPKTTFDVFTADTDVLKKSIEKCGLQNGDWITTLYVSPEELPKYLRNCDVGFSFRRGGVSTLGVSPIKIADYLLNGVPVVGTEDIGDGAISERSDVFFAMDPTGRKDQEMLLNWLDAVVFKNRDRVSRECQTMGRQLFDVSLSVEAYSKAVNFALSTKRSN